MGLSLLLTKRTKTIWLTIRLVDSNSLDEERNENPETIIRIAFFLQQIICTVVLSCRSYPLADRFQGLFASSGSPVLRVISIATTILF